MVYWIDVDDTVCPEGCCLRGLDPEFEPPGHGYGYQHVRPMFEVLDPQYSNCEAVWAQSEDGSL